MSMIPVSNGPNEHNNRSKLTGIDLDGAHLPATGVKDTVTPKKKSQAKMLRESC